jgi:hypothetical protein
VSAPYDLKEIEPEPRLRELWDRAQYPREHWPRIFTNTRGLRVLLSRDLGLNESDPRWHISVSYEDHIPDWEEMVQIAHNLRPGVFFVIGVPPESMWMSVHPYALHLCETTDEGLIAEWKRNARGRRRDQQ